MNCTITPNPDIAGVGIRIAIYVQAFLALIPSALAFWKAETTTPVTRVGDDAQRLISLESPFKDLPDPEVDLDTVVDLETNSITVLLTGISLLISAFIQADLYGLTLYHALIVLDLSWLNNITASLSFFISFLLEQRAPSRLVPHYILTDQMIVYVAHFSLTGAFGIWVFATVDTFGGNGSCNSEVLYYAFGHKISATSNRLRIFSLVEYSLAAVPLLNMLLLLLLMVCGGVFMWWISILMSCTYTYRPKAIETYWLFMALFLDILLIVSAEGIVSINSASVGEGEGDWTFGQTLALLILVIPLVDVLSKIRRAWNERRREGESWMPLEDMHSTEAQTLTTPEEPWTGLVNVQCVDILG